MLQKQKQPAKRKQATRRLVYARVEQSTVDRIDAWRRLQRGDIPARTKAIAELLNLALIAEKPGEAAG
jgi:hypothetical protein